MRRRPGRWTVVGLLAALVTVLLCAALALGAGGVAYYVGPLEATSFWLSQTALVVGGGYAVTREQQRSNGWLMLLTALVFAVGDSAFSFSGYVLRPVGWVLLAVLMLRWPGTHLEGRAHRTFTVVALTATPSLGLVDALLWDPVWGGYDGEDPWPSLVGVLGTGEAVHGVAYGASRLFQLAGIAVLAVLVVRRLVRAGRLERRELTPVALAGISALVAASLAVVAETYAFVPLAVYAAAALAVHVTVAVLPVSLLLGAVVTRVQRALAVEALLEPSRTTTPEAVRTALSRVLGDRGLVLEVLDAEGGVLGRAGPAAGPEGGRRVDVELTGADGERLARLEVDPRVAARSDLVEAIGRAAGVALDRARLLLALRSEQDDVRRLTSLVPHGLAARLRSDPGAAGRTERLEVSVLMSDVRGYTGLAESADPTALAAQLREHRGAMNAAVTAEGGTVMQYVGDAVLAVFGAPEPLPGHAAAALRAALAMHAAQARLDAVWAQRGLPAFGLGIGVATGEVAAGLVGGDDRAEYTVVGDVVNLSARLCDAARPAGSTVAVRGRCWPLGGRLAARPGGGRRRPAALRGQGPCRVGAGAPGDPGGGRAAARARCSAHAERLTRDVVVALRSGGAALVGRCRRRRGARGGVVRAQAGVARHVVVGPAAGVGCAGGAVGAALVAGRPHAGVARHVVVALVCSGLDHGCLLVSAPVAPGT